MVSHWGQAISMLMLKKFLGMNLISNYLIGDINVTSPTGLPQYKNLSGINLAKNFWNEAEKLK